MFEASYPSTNLYFAKEHPCATIPSKREEDAGYDLFPCFDEEQIWIRPHESKLIPTGLVSAFDPGFVMIVKERGSTATRNMQVGAGVIDSGFRGNIFVSIYNGNNHDVVITKDVSRIYNCDTIVYPYNKAIGQAIMVEVPRMTVKEITLEEIMEIESERGTGMIGSSGR